MGARLLVGRDTELRINGYPVRNQTSDSKVITLRVISLHHGIMVRGGVPKHTMSLFRNYPRVCQLPNKDNLPKYLRTSPLFETGTSPIAVNCPSKGASASITATCGIPAKLSCLSNARSRGSFSTASTTAFVPLGIGASADSPAAWTICAAKKPKGKSFRIII